VGCAVCYPIGVFFQPPLKKVNHKLGELIMSTEAQTCAIACTVGGILANRRLGQRIVLNLGHFDFDIVSDLDIRISDFNHSGCFMQNKANLLNAQMNVTSLITKTCENNLCSGLLENKPNSKPIQSQSKPIQSQNKPNQTQFQTLHLQKTQFFPPKPPLLPMLNAAS